MDGIGIAAGFFFAKMAIYSVRLQSHSQWVVFFYTTSLVWASLMF